MKTRLTLLVTLGTLLLGVDWPAYSQDEATPPPAHPTIAALSGDFSLEKKFTYTTPQDAPHLTPDQQAAYDFLHPQSAKLVEVNAASKGGVRRDIQHFANGKGLEIWRVQDYRLTMWPDKPKSIVVNLVSTVNDPSSPNQYHDATDFPELDWAANAGFSAVKMYGDKKCFVYKLGDQVLWVDAATHLPAFYESKILQVTYTWSAAPDAPLQLPEGAVQKIEKFKHAL